MPALSWNEIRQRAIQFSREWKGAADERAEAQTFWNEFFNVFGIKRRTVASFEEPVKSIQDTYHFIDLFWRGKLLAEHKTRGKSLEKAESQAFQYIQELASSGRHDEIPRYVILSDFNRIVLFDLEPEEETEGPLRTEIHLEDLYAQVKHFAFLIGQKTHKFGEEDEANLKAAAIMADLHDAVAESNYDPHALEKLLVRILFCLFADDTGIFEPAQFELFITNRTRDDGSDLGPQLNALFEVLDSPEDRRPRYIDEDLAAFPYINGELFAERLPTAGFNPAMRTAVLTACRFDWSRISPAIFGSLFQGIMDAKARRQIGAHYTSERDIMKLIRPLFLDELRAEFEQIRKDTRKTQRENRLKEFRDKLTKLNFLDPACGCGNFLVIAYRELRRLEHDILDALYDFAAHGEELDLGEEGRASRVDVDQFYGIEIGEWPARIAETALWLTDHKMNIELSQATGYLYQRIPLRAAPHIRCANALRFDWNDLLPADKCSYVLGNPPFVGYTFQSKEQKEDLRLIAGHVRNCGLLDYVTLWYFRAVEYIDGSDIRCAFVSTNSITQGEQVGVLWTELFKRGVKIHFAHRTFSWQSEAKGKAHVHVVIIGFGLNDVPTKRIFEYDDIKGEPAERIVSNIAPYLVEGGDVVVVNRSKPLCPVVNIRKGSQPTDGGALLMTDEEKQQIVGRDHNIERFIRLFLGAAEFINSIPRWCFWLHGIDPNEYRGHDEIIKRLCAVKNMRLSSKKQQTRKDAARPYEFSEIRQPETDYLLIPSVSSERREYIPIGFLPQRVIASNLCLTVSNATPYHFGILTSAMHMAWVRQVCGRLKSDFRYSAKLVYNNFPWPMDATDAQRAAVEDCAEKILAARKGYLDGGATLADLYDPLTMPAALFKAHQALDRAVDRCYRPQKFDSERDRVEHLFQLYEQLTAPLAPTAAGGKTRRRKQQ